MYITYFTASSFTFGREDVLAEVFKQLIQQPIIKNDTRLKKIELYLDRHIELDGDIHSVLAKKLVATICQGSKNKQKIVILHEKY